MSAIQPADTRIERDGDLVPSVQVLLTKAAQQMARKTVCLESFLDAWAEPRYGLVLSSSRLCPLAVALLFHTLCRILFLRVDNEAVPNLFLARLEWKRN